MAGQTGSRGLTLALRRWPPTAPMLRPLPRLPDALWRPRRRLPVWLRAYLLVELPLPATTLPAIPSLFQHGLAPIPSCLAVQGVLAALQSAQSHQRGWLRADDGRLAFRYQKKGGVITTTLAPDTAARQAFALDSPWRSVRELDDLDGDVLLIALAHALHEPCRQSNDTTWLTADAILDARGLQPKMQRAGRLRYRAGHRRADRRRVAASIDRLNHLWVSLRDVARLDTTATHGRPRQTTHQHTGKLLHITDCLLLHGVPVAWRYRPGDWLAPFLTRPNRQVALLPWPALRYDPYHERWEKRLARYFTFHLRMDAAHAAPLARRIGPLLDELNLPIDRRHPERTRARLEGALERLAADGVIGAWAYTPTARARLAVLPARHWLDVWRQAAIAVTPALEVAARYAPLAGRARLR